MAKIYCPICNNEPNHFIQKGATLYSQCASCRTVFCGTLNQEGLVGGEFEEERNNNQNHLRIERVDQMSEGIPKEEVRILDFGCGSGMFIDDLKSAGYIHVDGYDGYNEKFCMVPKKNSYHIVTATEVFEHFAFPFMEVDVIYRSLVNGGCCLVETGIIDAAYEDGYTVDDWFYINPEAGHSTVFSTHGLDVLMVSKGFKVRQSFNNYVKLYQKIEK